MLEEARGFTRLKLANIFLKGVDDSTGSCAHKCGWSSVNAFAYLQELRQQDLWPENLSRLPISRAIENVSGMPDPRPKERNASPYEHPQLWDASHGCVIADWLQATSAAS
jgi:hypothetical protein